MSHPSGAEARTHFSGSHGTSKLVPFQDEFKLKDSLSPSSLYYSVCTSTESTAGKSRTIGAQLSPASLEAYTCPPVVPK